MFKRHSYVVETIGLPLRLEVQQFDLIFACRKTSKGNPFLAGVKYTKNMLETTDYKLVDSLKEYIVTGKPPGLLWFMIENPEETLERNKTARRYGIK